jgi:thiamine-monophosphate kinase
VTLLSLGLRDSLPLDAFDEFVDAFAAAAARERVAVVGGNLTRSPGPWFVEVTAIGAVGRRKVLTRAAGRPGYELYVTGSLGAARAGLAWLMQKAEPGAAPAEGTGLAEAVQRYRRPEPRVRAGVLVGRNRAAACCMDLSDGLADAVTQVAESSATGAEIELAALPVHPAVPEIWPEEPAWQALLGGDDYELLFAVPPRRRRAFLAAVTQGRHVPITRIGRLTGASEGLRVRRPDGRVVGMPRGYEHFA